jgi:Ca2+-binding EF-hand superfamily protein
LLLQPMAMPGFTDVLTSAGAKREYCTQFFKAFDRNHDGFVDYDEFLLGMVAMVRS